MKTLSVIIPCYNEQECIDNIYAQLQIQNELIREQDCEMEIIFVDDGSNDNTEKAIKNIQASNKAVKSVILTRNFGKESAIYAGLIESTGDYVLLIDADLQDPPELIPQMLATVLEGEYDCVATRRVTRKGEPIIRSFFARKFYKLMNKISDITVVDGARDFRLMTREMTDAVISVSERNRFSKGIFSWVGFKTKWIEFKNIERANGETKWSFFKLMLYAMDGLTAFSTKPLAISSIIGLVFCALSLLFILVIIARTLILGDPVSGWPSLVCIMFFLSGVQLFCIGILGIYLSKNYIETKNRPIYLKRKNSQDNHSEIKE